MAKQVPCISTPSMQITPIADLEKHAILEAIRPIKWGQVDGCAVARDWQDNPVPQAQAVPIQ